MNRTHVFMVVLAFLLLMAVNPMFISPLEAQQSPLVYVDPSVTTVSAGQQFAVSIWVSNVADVSVWAWQAGIHWDSKILQFVSFAWGDFAAGTGGLTIQGYSTITNESIATAKTFLESAVNPNNAVALSAPLKLVTLTFLAIGTTTGSPLNLEDVSLVARDPVIKTDSYTWPDVNNDGKVDMRDIVYTLRNAIQGTNTPPTDFNKDDIVDITDVAIVSSDFGVIYPSPDWGWTNLMSNIPTDLQDGSVIVTSGTNLYLSMNAPASIGHGTTMDYTLYYENFGNVEAQNVVLTTTLSPDVDFVSASEGGAYDAGSRTITWNIGSVSGYPSGQGSANVEVTIPGSLAAGTVIQTTAYISTDTTETTTDDNSANAQTTIVALDLPPDVGVSPTVGNTGGTPSVYWGTPTTFTYYAPTATGVDITIHFDDGGPDITGSMTGGPPTWAFTVTFYPRHGYAAVGYTVHYSDGDSQVGFSIYVDPAGYVYDVNTRLRISGASVWLQRPDGQGGWENVPTGQNPPVMQPDENPQITGPDGQYQWDVLNGAYRVHVEAPGYYPADSIVVNVPPAVNDLDVGLTEHRDVAVADVASSKTVVFQSFHVNVTVTVADLGDYPETFNVTVYANATSVASQNVTLLSGEFAYVTFICDTAGLALGNCSISAYAQPVLGETNKANNNLTDSWIFASMVGDLTGPTAFVPDNKVDIRDIAIVAKGFGSTPGMSGWDANCDVTGPTPGLPDGKIDIRDIALVAKHFGEHNP